MFIAIIFLVGCSSTQQETKSEEANVETNYVTSEVLDVYRSPNTTDDVITSAKLNDEVTVFETNGEWSQIEFNGKTGYALNEFLSSSKQEIEITTIQNSDGQKSTVQVANVESSTEDNAKDADNKEEQKDTAIESEETKEPISTHTPIDPITKYVTANSLNVRDSASSNGKVISSLKRNQEVTAYEVSGDWSKIKTNTTDGWVSTKYLTTTKPDVKETVVQKAEEPKEDRQVKEDTTEKKQTTQNSAPESKEENKQSEANLNVADQLKTVDGNRQLILVTANGYNTSKATIQTFEKDDSGKWNPVLNVSGFIGKNGFTKDKKEGDGKTPVGKYTIGDAFGQKGNPGTKLSFLNITEDDVWVDDPESPLYNSWQSKSQTQGQWNSAEDMTHRLYTYGFIINYNTNRVPYKGSAIFFHVGSGHTLGCTATSESNVISILKWIHPAKNPVIIQTPVQDLGNY